MEKSEERDWYQGVLSGAMKFIENKEKDQEETTSYGDIFAQIEVDRQTFLLILGGGEDKEQFYKYIQSGFRRFGNRELLTRGIAEALNQRLGLESPNYKINYLAKSRVVSGGIPNRDPITEEELDEKIATQLSAVIDKSILELQELRKEFKSTSQAMRNAFQQRLLQLSGRNDGEAQ